MKKIILFLLICNIVIAENFKEALEFEKKGDYKKAMQIYKKIALKYQNNSPSPINKNLQANLNQNANTKENLDSLKNKKENFSQLTLANYLGEDTDFNPLGISAYKMNYFLPFAYSFNSIRNDNRKTEMKFQLSIKKRLFENLFGLNEKYYIGYTQTSWWQNYKHSSPFRETNYQPEFFVDFPLFLKDYQFFNNLRLGFLHESNGKGDENLESRSWNRIYASTAILYKRFLIVPRIWYRIPEERKDDDNPDITHYLGNFDLNLGYLGKDYFANIMLRNNLNLRRNKGAIQVDAGYDIFNNGIYWYLQYFNGYGESLIDYNRKLQRISTGFLISY
ncbi:phospholipase A [Campylobacter estrildidarum]|uniref:Phosphatidylcholine 1-acylhydrolase n=1 Tax=Campylobacter estrildidarum TaxID=2510189 RepID=A0A4U7BK29_9BACT|nr:phospholipase A [Campylobacter estrildidarum]TKX30555.1 phospholipase [Campylobacter estrildidarum]